jgi:NAD(P)-dependent dehydrogenase (short-subunit alcohol dehydrogenase family)
MTHAIVLGAAPGSGNIGTVIAEHLREDGWKVAEDDCHRPNSHHRFNPPAGTQLRRHDACVITVGHTRLTPFHTAKAYDISEVLYGSLELPLQCARRYVQAREDGQLIFIGSYAHDHALTGCAAYCAAKAGLSQAVRELAWELAPDFEVHIIHPYHVPSTPMGLDVLEGLMNSRGMTQSEAEAYQRKDLKQPDHLTPSEVAKVVSWLLRPDTPAGWLSGTGISLYGGVR